MKNNHSKDQRHLMKIHKEWSTVEKEEVGEDVVDVSVTNHSVFSIGAVHAYESETIFNNEKNKRRAKL